MVAHVLCKHEVGVRFSYPPPILLGHCVMVAQQTLTLLA